MTSPINDSDNNSHHQAPAKTDKVFAQPLDDIGQFCFDEAVANVFADMIKRSVPGYSTILKMISDIAARYAQPNSHCYDLGCSLGASTLALSYGIDADNCHIIGIDNSEAMVNRCRTMLADANRTHTQPVTIDIHCADIEDVAINNASIVVLNFTLQFIAPKSRERIIQRIYNGLLPGGILLLSEKVKFEDSLHQHLMTELYHNFKRNNGYSDLEIAQKRTALENVLRPDSLSEHRERLQKCGFTSAETWFQCFNFTSLIAIK